MALGGVEGKRALLSKSRKCPTELGGGSRGAEKQCLLSAGRAGKDSAQREMAEIHFTFTT